jgi:hypothetical protein
MKKKKLNYVQAEKESISRKSREKLKNKNKNLKFLQLTKKRPFFKKNQCFRKLKTAKIQLENKLKLKSALKKP